MTGMFFVMYSNSVFFSVFSSVLAIGDKSDLGRQFVPMLVFVWFWNSDDCGTYPKMGYCVSVEGNAVHFC